MTVDVYAHVLATEMPGERRTCLPGASPRPSSARVLDRLAARAGLAALSGAIFLAPANAEVER
jgi:hypothetical protein